MAILIDFVTFSLTRTEGIHQVRVLAEEELLSDTEVNFKKVSAVFFFKLSMQLYHSNMALLKKSCDTSEHIRIPLEYKTQT